MSKTNKLINSEIPKTPKKNTILKTKSNCKTTIPKKSAQKTPKKRKIEKNFPNSILNTKTTYNEFNLLKEVRLRIYKMILAGILYQYEKHQCTYDTYKTTKKIVQILMEELSKPLSIYTEHSNTRNLGLEDLNWKLLKIPFLGDFFKNRLYNELFRLYDFFSTILFILKEIVNGSEENILFQLLHSKKKIIRELKKDIESFQESIDQSFSMLSMSAVQTRKATNILINYQFDLVKEYYMKGELTEKEYKISRKFIKKIKMKSEDIELQVEKENEKFDQFERRLKFMFVLLYHFSEENMDELEKLIVVRKMKKGEVLYKIGQKVQKVYLIFQGVVAMRIKNNKNIKNHSKGEIVGLENIYLENENSITEAKILNDGILYELPIDFFYKISLVLPDLEFFCKQETAFFYIKNISKSELKKKNKFFEQMKNFKGLYLHTILKNSHPHKFSKDQSIFIQNPIFIFKGSLLCKFEGKKGKDDIIVGERDVASLGGKFVKALEDTYFLEMNIDDYLK